MPPQDQDFQAAHEIGKIFNSLVEKKVLCDFFLTSTFPFINPTSGYLFLAGNKNQIWLEASAGADGAAAEIEKEAQNVMKDGRPVQKEQRIYLPLIVRSSNLGVACFVKDQGNFSQKDFDLAFDLASQLAGALKNILLHEENLKMERLAAVGQTISMVMHELKNIIQIAKLADELLRKGLKDNNEKFLKHGLEGTAKALRDMDGFVWDMLSLTKGFHIEPQKMKVETLAEELKKDLADKCEQLQVKLDCSVEPGLEADADPRSLYRAILNLVQNAVEASDKDDAFIRLSAKSFDSDKYQIVIEDNGRGMSAEVKAKIFQAFFSTKGRKGNGLGLMIVERTLKEHRGDIQFESEPGKGTTFFITLPKQLPKEAD